MYASRKSPGRVGIGREDTSQQGHGVEPLAPGQRVAGPSGLGGHLRLAGNPMDPPVGQFGAEDRNAVAVVYLHPVGKILDLADLNPRVGVESAQLFGLLGHPDEVFRPRVVAGNIEGQVRIVRIVRIFLQAGQQPFVPTPPVTGVSWVRTRLPSGDSHQKTNGTSSPRTPLFAPICRSRTPLRARICGKTRVWPGTSVCLAQPICFLWRSSSSFDGYNARAMSSMPQK